MIDGIWWLVILISVVVGLWLLAKARGAKAASSDNTNELPKNDPLQKTAALVKRSFPEYQVSRKANRTANRVATSSSPCPQDQEPG